MSLNDDLAAAERCLDELNRTVGRLERQLDDSLDVRRVRADADHLRESVALLRASTNSPAPPRPPEVVRVPDTPYDSALWTDSDDEGLGSQDRHAP
ncbi:hypothetical protein [Streptomyces sp. NPDC046821]|uniref:hypothetical protein n=1 Tax=Streptomyces sp. NPDC046821 TaxID=3154702 RepID=UPI0033F0785D